MTRKPSKSLAFVLGFVSFILSLVASAALHLSLPPARKAGASLLEGFLNQTFIGHFSVGQVRRLDPFGVQLEGAVIRDPDGRVVLRVPSLEVSFDLVDTFVRVVEHHQKLSFVLERVDLESPEVNLLDGKAETEGGAPGLSLAQTFALRDQTPSQSPGEQRVRVWFPDIRIKKAHGQGKLSLFKAGEFHGDAEGQLLVTTAGVALDVTALRFEVNGIVSQPIKLGGTYSLRYPGPMNADLNFAVGDCVGDEKVEYEAGRVTASGSFENLDPDILRQLWPASPVRRELNLVHEVSGVLPRLGIRAEVSNDKGALSAEGRIRVAPELEADLDIDANNFDLSTIRPEWPTTNLSLRSAVEVWGSEGQPVVSWNATILPGEIEDTKNPAVDSAGTLDERGLQGTVTIHERGLPLHVAFSKLPEKKLDFEATLKRTHLEEAPRIQSFIALRGELEGLVKGSLDGDRLRIEPSLSGSSFSYQDYALTNYTLKGSAETKLDALTSGFANVELDAAEVKLLGRTLHKVQAKAEGPYQEPKFELSAVTDDDLKLELKGRSRTDRLLIRELNGQITGDNKPILLSAKEISSFEDQHQALGLVIESTGRLAGDVRVNSGTAELHLQGNNVDLGRVGRLLGFAPGTLEGKLDLEANGTLGQHSDAKFGLRLVDGGFAGVIGSDVDATATFKDSTVVSTVDVNVNELGRLHAQTELKLSGSPLLASSYPDSVGQGQIDLEHIKLAMAAKFAGWTLPVVVQNGEANGRIDLKKKASSSLPTLHADLATTGLTLKLQSQDLSSSGIDLRLRGDVDPEQDKLSMALDLQDPFGELVSSSGELTLPFRTWGDSVPTLEEIKNSSEEAPLAISIALPRRDLRDMPAALSDWANMDGSIEVRSAVRGSLKSPVIEGNIELHDLQGSTAGLTEPIGLVAKLRYDPTTSSLDGQVSGEAKNQQVLSGTLHVQFAKGGSSPPNPTAPAWTGRTQFTFDDAPLSLIEPLKEQKIDGLLRGALVVERSDSIPKIRADLRVRQLTLVEQPLGDGQLRLTTTGSTLSADAEFNDEFGTLKVNVDGHVVGTPWALELATPSPLNLRVEASRFDAAVLSPALDGVLTNLRGSLEGKLQAELRFPEQAGQELDATLTGNMRLTAGAMTPSSMGLRLEDVELNVEVAPSRGYNVVKLTDIRAKARSEVHNLKGKGVLYFRGLELSEGQLNLSQSRLPVLSDGVKLADLTGQLSLKLKKEKEQLVVELEVPELEAVLPNSTDRDLIELKENETITVIGPTVVKEQAKKQSQAEGLPVVVNVHFGPRVRLKSSFASVRLEGEPVVRFADKLSINGQVGLAQGGRIEVLGRVFIIDHGAVFFDEEGIANPLVDASATWRASSGALIRATLTGRAYNPRLEWSSDPPLPGGEPAIIALVLGGGGNSSQGNTGIAYGAAAINQVLGQSGVRGIEITAGHESQSEGQMARFSNGGWNSYAAAVQISEEVWFEGKYTRETTGPDATQRSGFSGTVDWRFHPSWSARTEVGTLGLGADLLWQYRY